MSDSYLELLDLAIQQLQDEKTRGVRYVPVSRETGEWLRSPLRPRPVRAAARAIAAAVAPASRPSSDQAVMPPSSPDMVRSGSGDAESSVAKKAAAISELRTRVLACQKCPHLVRSRKNVVFGVGNIDAELMFVGEAPGADEDAQGEPFVGAAGQLLTRIIVAMGFARNDVYIANILKCRPDTPGQVTGNRKPTLDEMKTCLPYLLSQIDLIQPKVIVALGGTAVEGLLGLSIGITRLRGRFQEFRGIPVMPTYHPSYLLRNQAMSVKREVWEDMLQVLEKLGKPITEKQRGYFLKSG